MDIVFSKPTIYISHPVRGTNDDMEGNCRKTMAAGKRIKRIFPECDFYIPADSDLILQVLYANKDLTVKQIIDADLEVLRACHGWCYLNFDESKGSEIEWVEACAQRLTGWKEHWIKDDLSKASYQVIRNRLTDCVSAAVERFRRGVKS